LYLVLSCDKVIDVDNISWISTHCYIVQNFAGQPIFIEGGCITTSLTTLMMGSFTSEITLW